MSPRRSWHASWQRVWSPVSVSLTALGTGRHVHLVTRTRRPRLRCGPHLHLPDDESCRTSWRVFIFHPFILFGEVCSELPHIDELGYFLIRLWGFFTYSGHKYFIKCMIWKYLLSICSWPYFPLECFLKIRCSYFWSDLIYLYFYGLYIGITSNSNSNCKIIPYFHLEILEFSIFHLGVWSF